MHSVSPRRTSKDTPSTARTTPSRLKNRVRRSRTERTMSESAAADGWAAGASVEAMVAPSITVAGRCAGRGSRSEEHTSELQSLMRISYAVFCLKKKNHYRGQRNSSSTLIADYQVSRVYT